MVHALKRARRVLKPRGLVVDIRSTGDPAVVLCETPAGRVIVGPLRGTHRKTRAATVRLDRVVREGLLRPCRSITFRFLHYASSLETLRRYLEDEWSDAWIDDATVKRIRVLLGPKATGTLILDEPAHIHVLVRTEVERIRRSPVLEEAR
jgi:hypothetical protein